MDRVVLFRYSKDGGNTWSNWKIRSLGELGDYRKRVVFGPLGRARSFVFEIAVSSPVRSDLLAASAAIERRE